MDNEIEIETLTWEKKIAKALKCKEADLL